MAKTYADIAGLPVKYLGESAAGQFVFANGVAIGTDVFSTIPEAVKRFGKRLEIGDPGMRYSSAWGNGKSDAQAGRPYFADLFRRHSQERLEYGFGYVAGLLEQKPMPAIAPVAQAAPVLVAPPEIMELGEDEPAAKPKKKRGRPRRNK